MPFSAAQNAIHSTKKQVNQTQCDSFSVTRVLVLQILLEQKTVLDLFGLDASSAGSVGSVGGDLSRLASQVAAACNLSADSQRDRAMALLREYLVMRVLAAAERERDLFARKQVRRSCLAAPLCSSVSSTRLRRIPPCAVLLRRTPPRTRAPASRGPSANGRAWLRWRRRRPWPARQTR